MTVNGGGVRRGRRDTLSLLVELSTPEDDEPPTR